MRWLSGLMAASFIVAIGCESKVTKTTSPDGTVERRTVEVDHKPPRAEPDTTKAKVNVDVNRQDGVKVQVEGKKKD